MSESRQFAIGDIQGCYDEFMTLLDKIQFDQSNDILWIAGDLVNRGPGSLETLRFIKSLGSATRSVLGNHDLHLLAVACGAGRLHRKDTLTPILEAPDADELLGWLRCQPLIVVDDNWVMVHAGVYPGWTLNEARERAREVEAVLMSPQWPIFCEHMYGDEPTLWNESLVGTDRLRFITNTFTRMRFSDHGEINTAFKGGPGDHPECVPWYDDPARVPIEQNIVFGHWSTLGLFERDDLVCLDTGCVWGGSLTALNLDGSRERFSVDSPGYLRPK